MKADKQKEDNPIHMVILEHKADYKLPEWLVDAMMDSHARQNELHDLLNQAYDNGSEADTEWQDTMVEKSFKLSMRYEDDLKAKVIAAFQRMKSYPHSHPYSSNPDPESDFCVICLSADEMISEYGGV